MGVSLRSGVIAVLAAFLFLLASPATGFCAPVTYGAARTIAGNKIRHHIDLYGHWNGSLTPTLADGQPIELEGVSLAYNFKVNPSGHILVAADDAFSPILLYSTKADFDTARLAEPNSVEAWILPELYHNTRNVEVLRRDSSGMVRSASENYPRTKISRAWRFLSQQPDPGNPPGSFSEVRADLTRSAAVGPLLATTWGQGSPYNLQTPPDSGCAHTVTGCVATAWAQLVRYWKWPVQGSGSHSYTWNLEILSADFGATVYDWKNMPSILTASSAQAQKEAVSLLMYHMGGGGGDELRLLQFRQFGLG